MLPMFSFMAVSAFGQQTISGISKQNMDLSAKPGTDFYEYSAGGWMKAHPLTPEYTRFGQFDQLHENNQAQVRELIEDLAKHQHAKGSLGQKIGSLYNLAMDSVRRNREGVAPHSSGACKSTRHSEQKRIPSCRSSTGA